MLGFHTAILVSLLIARPNIPLSIVFKHGNMKWILVSILLCGSSGVTLYLFSNHFGFANDLPAQVKALGLDSSTWLQFITYFTLVNPFIEEYFWRGYLGDQAKGFHMSDFLYSGFHAMILIDKMRAGSIIFALFMLLLTGWFWRQIARQDEGLLAAVLGHMAADFTILVTVYKMVT